MSGEERLEPGLLQLQQVWPLCAQMPTLTQEENPGTTSPKLIIVNLDDHVLMMVQCCLESKLGIWLKENCDSLDKSDIKGRLAKHADAWKSVFRCRNS